MLMLPKFEILKERITYTGSELRPHWGLEQTKIYGSLLTAFVGPCEVKTGELVDMEDRLASDFIRSKSMLHVIGEFFGTTLEAGVLYQRLLISHAEDRLRLAGWPKIERRGDDLMIGDRKLSVSIATVSPVSVLIHWGMNIDSTGAPVKAIGFSELGWNETKALEFAHELLAGFCEEIKDIQIAQCKVRAV